MKQKHCTSLFMLKKYTILFSAGMLLMSLGIFAGCKKQAGVTPTKTTSIVTKQQSDYINTPFGKVLASKVHLVEQGSEITVTDGTIKKINSATGEILADYGSATPESTNNTASKFSARNLSTQSSGGTLGNGYYVYGDFPSGENIKSFSTSWVVPNAPVAGADSTLFLWNGADNSVSGCFMQPVLEWNNINPGKWDIANWGYANGSYFHSNAIVVTPGTTVTGVMTQVSAKSGAYKYTIAFSGYSSITYTQTYPDPANEVIECWEAYANSYTDFPPNKYVAMQSMNVQLVGQGSTNQPITWQQSSDGAIVTPSGKNTVIQNNGTNNSIVDFYFQ